MDPFTMMQIGGTALSVLGGLKDRKQQARLDLGALRKEAKANGFNPQTVLRMTGGQGFINQPTPSVLSILGGGISDVAGIMQYGQDRAQQSAESNARIKLMGAQTAEFGRLSGGVRPVSIAGVSGAIDAIDPAWTTEKPPLNFDPSLPMEEKERLLNSGDTTGISGVNENLAPVFTAFGIDFMPSGGWSGGETMEAAGGEPLQWATSIPLTIDTVLNTAANAVGIGEFWRTPIKEYKIWQQIQRPISSHSSGVYDRLSDHFDSQQGVWE